MTTTLEFSAFAKGCSGATENDIVQARSDWKLCYYKTNRQPVMSIILHEYNPQDYTENDYRNKMNAMEQQLRITIEATSIETVLNLYKTCKPTDFKKKLLKVPFYYLIARRIPRTDENQVLYTYNAKWTENNPNLDKVNKILQIPEDIINQYAEAMQAYCKYITYCKEAFGAMIPWKCLQEYEIDYEFKPDQIKTVLQLYKDGTWKDYIYKFLKKIENDTRIYIE